MGALLSALTVLGSLSAAPGAQGQGSVGGLRVYGAFVDYDARTIEITGEGLDLERGSLSVTLEGSGDLTRACMVDVSAQPQRISCRVFPTPNITSHKLSISRRRHKYTLPIGKAPQGRRPAAGLQVGEVQLDFDARTIEISGQDFDSAPLTISFLEGYGEDYGDISKLCRVDAAATPHRISCDFPGQGLSPDAPYFTATVAKGGHSHALTIFSKDRSSQTTAPAAPRLGSGIQVRGNPAPTGEAGLQVALAYLNTETRTIEITGEDFDSIAGPLTVTLKGFGDISARCRLDASKLPQRISCDFPGPEIPEDASYYVLTVAKGEYSYATAIYPTHPVAMQVGNGQICRHILLLGLPDPDQYRKGRGGRKVEAAPDAAPPYVPCPCNVPAVIREDDWPLGATIRVACTASCTAAIVTSNASRQPYLNATKDYSFQSERRFSCNAETPLRWLARPPSLVFEQLSACSYSMLDFLRELRDARPDLVFTGDDLDACRPIR